MAAEVDIPGFNYSPMHYEQILKEHPDWTIVATETASCVSSRGVYHLPIVAYEKPSRSRFRVMTRRPGLGHVPDVEFTYQDKFRRCSASSSGPASTISASRRPSGVAGQESQDWPSRSSYFGFIDLAGFPKDRYYLYQSQWSAKPWCTCCRIGIGRQGRSGDSGDGYSNAEEVELFLNANRSVRRRVSRTFGRCPWDEGE